MVWVLMIAVLVGLWQVFGKNLAGPKETTISFSQLLDQAKQGKVDTLVVNSGSSTAAAKANGQYKMVCNGIKF